MADRFGADLVLEAVGFDVKLDGADLVLVGIGSSPNIELAQSAGLDCDNGILVNSICQTSDPNIYAVGDAVEVRDIVTGFPTLTALAGPANKQAQQAVNKWIGS